MPRPRYIYKYQPPDALNIENLRNRSLWCAHPSTFNDPFDCAESLVWNRPTEVLSEIGFDRLLNADDRQLFEMAVQVAAAEESEGSGYSPVEVFVRHQLENCKGVVCFSEKRDNLLMWSHYAEKHKGFCLKFETRGEYWDRLLSVKYQSKMPTAKGTVRKRGTAIDLTTFLLVKSKEWEYEKEWRLIRDVCDQLMGYPGESLKAVYLGARVAPEIAEQIGATIDTARVQLFRMELAANRFKLKKRRV